MLSEGREDGRRLRGTEGEVAGGYIYKYRFHCDGVAQ